MGTPFIEVYNRFLGKITDDMYVELTPQDTLRDLQHLLIDAIPGFEFPRKDLAQYTQDNLNEGLEDTSSFLEELSSEEINILAILMMIGWIQRQITSIDNTRQKYYGESFQLTSQASHLKSLISLKEDLQKDTRKLQRLYKRRKIDNDGTISSNWSIFNTYK